MFIRSPLPTLLNTPLPNPNRYSHIWVYIKLYLCLHMYIFTHICTQIYTRSYVYIKGQSTLSNPMGWSSLVWTTGLEPKIMIRGHFPWPRGISLVTKILTPSFICSSQPPEKITGFIPSQVYFKGVTTLIQFPCPRLTFVAGSGSDLFELVVTGVHSSYPIMDFIFHVKILENDYICLLKSSYLFTGYICFKVYEIIK